MGAGRMIGKFIGGVIGAAAAVVAGAYIIGKIASEDQKEEDEEEVTLIKLEKEEEKGEPREEESEEIPERKVKEPEAVKEASQEVDEIKIEGPQEEKEEPAEEPEEEEKEEPAEEPKEERKEEPSEVPQEENPYPLLSAHKASSICKQVGAMLESAPDAKVLRLNHYVLFEDEDAAMKYAEKKNGDGFDVAVNKDNPKEVHLIRQAEAEKGLLEKMILGLAEEAAEDKGTYKGWAIEPEQE